MIQNRAFIVCATLVTLVSLAAFSVNSTDSTDEYSDAQAPAMLGPGEPKVWVHRAHWREIEERRNMPEVVGWDPIAPPTLARSAR